MNMTNDSLYRYLFEGVSVRGELVQLADTYQQIISSKEYPAPVQNLLGELLVATSLLTATLKFEGSITVQLQGDGPIKLAVINGDHDQKMRGVARWDGDVPATGNIHDLIGKGHMVITITPTKGERYQGVVGLEGTTLAECLKVTLQIQNNLRRKSSCALANTKKKQWLLACCYKSCLMAKAVPMTSITCLS